MEEKKPEQYDRNKTHKIHSKIAMNSEQKQNC